MPLKMLTNLDDRAAELAGWRARLQDDPLALDRAEGAWRAFSRVRGLILADMSTLYETRGLAAGMALVGPILRQGQDEARDAVGREDLEPELGRAKIEVLAETAKALERAMEVHRREAATVAGRVDGYWTVAGLHLDDLREVLVKHDRDQRLAVEEDWSGRGTPHGQRPPEDGGNEVTK